MKMLTILCREQFEDEVVAALVAFEDERMNLFVKDVKQLLVRLVKERLGHPVPLKAFVQPCEPVL